MPEWWWRRTHRRRFPGVCLARAVADQPSLSCSTALLPRRPVLLPDHPQGMALVNGDPGTHTAFAPKPHGGPSFDLASHYVQLRPVPPSGGVAHRDGAHLLLVHQKSLIRELPAEAEPIEALRQYRLRLYFTSPITLVPPAMRPMSYSRFRMHRGEILEIFLVSLENSHLLLYVRLTLETSVTMLLTETSPIAFS